MKIKNDVIKLSMPIIAEQFLTVFLGVVNAIIASQIGKETASAISMADSINVIFISVFSSLAVGGTVIVAQFKGRNDRSAANEAAGQAIVSAVLLSSFLALAMWIFRYKILYILYSSAQPDVLEQSNLYFGITLFTYPLIALILAASGILRGAGDTKTPMKVNVMMNIANVIFSYVLVYGINIRFLHIHIPAFKIKGAAAGIGLARLLGAVAITYALLRGSETISLETGNLFKINWDLQKKIFSIGIPAALESLLFNGGKLITQVFVVAMGTVATAVFYVTSSMNNLYSVPINSFAIAATTLVGHHMGSGDDKKAEKVMIYLVKLATLFTAAICIPSIPFVKYLSLLYSRDAEVIDLSSDILLVYCIVTLFILPASFVLPAGFKGAGDAKYTLATSFISMWIFRVAGGYIFGVVLKMGVQGIWIGMYTDWLAREILYYIRLKSGKWKMHDILKEPEPVPERKNR